MSRTNEAEFDIIPTQEQVESYRDLGYLVVRDVFTSSEITQFAESVEQVIAQRSEALRPGNLRVRHKAHFQTAEMMLEVVDPISDICPMASQIAKDTRITNILESIYGEKAFLFKDKYFFKPSGSLGLDLHQDWIGWPGFPKSFITVLVAIDPFQEASGGTKVYPQMHKHGYLSNCDGKHHVLDHGQMNTKAVCLDLMPGDIALFGCFTPHYSETNTTGSTRRGYFISYNAQSDGGDRFRSHYAEFHRWVLDRAPESKRGELFFE